MKCPRCVQIIHQAAVSCPHCGFVMEHADQLFGGDFLRLSKLTDFAGVLRMKEREKLRAVMQRFEKKFPQFFISVYLGDFQDDTSVEQFGFWVLNRAEYSDVEDRGNEGGILIAVDVNAKQAGITFGYALASYLEEDSTFVALSAGHPAFLRGNYLDALITVIKRLEVSLVRRHRKVKKPKQTSAQVAESAAPLPGKEISE